MKYIHGHNSVSTRVINAEIADDSIQLVHTERPGTIPKNEGCRTCINQSVDPCLCKVTENVYHPIRGSVKSLTSCHQRNRNGDCQDYQYSSFNVLNACLGWMR